MTIKLTERKRKGIHNLVTQVINSRHRVQIRFVAKLIGCFIASLPAIMHGALYYKYLEKDKIVALKSCKGNFGDFMSISDQSFTGGKLTLTLALTVLDTLLTLNGCLILQP